MAVPSARLMAAAVLARLRSPLVMPVYESVADDPPVDAGGTVGSYAVLHPGPGDPASLSLTGQPDQLVWSFQTSCYGGSHDYLLGASDLVTSRLAGWRMTVSGTQVGLVALAFGFSAPPARVELDPASVTRLMVPLLWSVLAVPA